MATPSDIHHHRFKAMGSPCEILLRGGEGRFNATLSRKLQAEIGRLEQAYSRFLPDSITTTINRNAGNGSFIELDDETLGLLDYADTCYRQSSGLFDITSGSLRSLWDYHDLEEKQALPTQHQVQQALEKVGWEKIERDGGRLRLPVPGMEIDFGGIVKEYAADCVANIAEAEGAGSGMVELGGDIRLFGMEANPEPWRIGIRDPFNPDRPRAMLSLARGALASSGDYERYTVIRGKKYSHILNPTTGWPVEGFSSVSVIAEQCVVAGSAASIAVLMGEQGEEWLNGLGLPYLCVAQDGEVRGTMEQQDQ